MKDINPFVETKKQRQQQVKEIIREAGSITQKKLVAIVAWDIGLKEKTLNEYLRIMVELGFIQWNAEDKTWSIKEE